MIIFRFDIKFPKPEPIYGIILQGSSLEDKFVTSYRVLFSENGDTFSYVLDDKKQPRVFRGPVDNLKPVEQKFYVPIEAKVIRINPLSWHNGIAIKVELIGCQELTIDRTPEYGPITTTVLPDEVINPGKGKIICTKLQSIIVFIVCIFIFLFSV